MTRLPRAPPAGAPAARLATFNAAVFLVVGIQLPFWPVWLAGHGLDAQEIATVFAAAIWAKVVATPAIGALADRIGRRRTVMAGLAVAACVFYAALWRITGFWPLLALNLLAGVAHSALLPLGDAVTLAAVRERGYDYGRIRVWGSISFIAASVGGGAALALLPAPAAGPDNRVLALVLAASALLFAACLAIPSARRLGAGDEHSALIGRRGAGSRRGAVGQLMADRRFWLLVVSAAALLRRQSGRRHPDHDRVVARQHDIDDDHRYQRAQFGHIQHGRRHKHKSPDHRRHRMTRLSRLRHSGQVGRLAVFNAAVFLVIGIQLPFWPVWLAGHGLDAEEIAAVFAAAIWAKVAATPAIGALADRIGRRRTVMAGLAGIACVFYSALWPVAGFWPLLGLNLVAGVAQSALMPLGDAVTLAAVRERGLDYGRIRVWGSVSFIVASLGGGAALALSPGPAVGPDNRILALVIAASLLLFAACLAIPSVATPRLGGRGAAGPGSRWDAVGRLAADRRFWLLVVSAAALQSSHQLYYGFGTLYWRELGFTDTVIGALWAEGVVAEIALFWYGAPLVARLGPLGLLVLGGVGGIVRWSLMGLIPGLGAAAALQLLHALTFGASHLGAMYMLARSVPPEAAASAQSLYVALSAGLGSGLVMLGAGTLYAAYGGQAYLFMAMLSAAGLLGVWQLRRAGAAAVA